MKNIKQKIAIFSVAILMIASIFIGINKDKIIENHETQPVPIPNFVLTDMNDNEVNFDSFKGKNTVLNFWCIPQTQQNNQLIEFDKLIGEYSNDFNFVLVAVLNDNTTKQSVTDFLTQNKLEHLPVYFDNNNQSSEIFGVDAYPTTLYIDSENFLYDACIGYESFEDIKKVLK